MEIYKSFSFVFVAILFSVLSFYFNGIAFDTYLNVQLFNGNRKLVIGILSARSNYHLRNVIRGTWGSHVKNLSDVDLKFIIGSHDCPIPIEYRLDQFSCENWNFSILNKTDHIIAVSENSYTQNYSDYTQFYHGLDVISFTIRHGVVFTHLGAHNSYIHCGVSVKLLEAVSMKEVVRSDFDIHEPGVVLSGFHFKKIQSFFLPRNFEGVLFLEKMNDNCNILPLSNTVNNFIDNGGGSIIFHFKDVEFYKKYGHFSFSKHSNIHLTISFIYSIHDSSYLHNLYSKISVQYLDWEKSVVNIENIINEELSLHDDLLMVPMIDVYRELPFKLIEFLKWASSEHYQFILKTDDDCYLDVQNILNHLPNSSNKIWWGNFREKWPVERYGKWKEVHYPNVIYPKFACGSGYILDHSVCSWISMNANYLKKYQGEDVSLGIWLSAIMSDFDYDSRFHCSKFCTSDMFSMPNNDINELSLLWKNRLKCGNPCDCEL